MGNFDMDLFLEHLSAVRESINESTKVAYTPEESALAATAAGTAEAPGGPGVSANEYYAEAAGQAMGNSAVQEHAAGVANEYADINRPMGNIAADPRVALEQKLERLTGQQLSATVEREMAYDTAISAPPNAVNMAKGAEYDNDLVGLLASIKDNLDKEASEEESDEVMKMAGEAIQFGRLMALGFVDGLRDITDEEVEE